MRVSALCTCTVFGVDSLSDAPIVHGYMCVCTCKAFGVGSLSESRSVHECVYVYAYRDTYCMKACVRLRLRGKVCAIQVE